MNETMYAMQEYVHRHRTASGWNETITEEIML